MSRIFLWLFILIIMGATTYVEFQVLDDAARINTLYWHLADLCGQVAVLEGNTPSEAAVTCLERYFPEPPPP